MTVKIEDGIKLDYSDVLIRPKLSSLATRDLLLNREFSTRWKSSFDAGIPIIASNMDHTGTLSMSKALSRLNCHTALDKYLLRDHFILVRNFLMDHPEVLNRTWLTLGMDGPVSVEDTQLLYSELIDAGHIFTKLICIDVANGYQDIFLDRVSQVRRDFPDAFIMAGNVVTPEMTQQIIRAGADCVKVGIGSGCFITGTKVKTISGEKSIEKIKVGEQVKTHLGRYKRVIATTTRKETELIMDVNGIKCTKNHEFFVAHKKDLDKINENNILQYASWIPAQDLSEDYLLVKIK